MSTPPRKASIAITITEFLPNGTTRFASRNATERGAGWASADNLGRDHTEHRDETAARLAMAGWLKSQAEKMAAGVSTPSSTVTALPLTPTSEPDVAEDQDLIG